MADPRGFLTVRQRELPPSRPVPVRLLDYRDVQADVRGSAANEARLRTQA
ncbi:MAG TPA: glutamate synthase, partial [Actinotalea sp.]|nr:glutamate synthase [Actinotalea sp.]